MMGEMLNLGGREAMLLIKSRGGYSGGSGGYIEGGIEHRHAHWPGVCLGI